jgi:hypothetical protein
MSQKYLYSTFFGEKKALTGKQYLGMFCPVYYKLNIV